MSPFITAQEMCVNCSALSWTSAPSWFPLSWVPHRPQCPALPTATSLPPDTAVVGPASLFGWWEGWHHPPFVSFTFSWWWLRPQNWQTSTSLAWCWQHQWSIPFLHLHPPFMHCSDAVRRAKTGLDTLQGMGFASALEATFVCIKFAQPPWSGWRIEQQQWQPMTHLGFVLSVPLVQGTRCDLTPPSPILPGGPAAFTPSPRAKIHTEAPEQPMATCTPRCCCQPQGMAVDVLHPTEMEHCSETSTS